MKNKAMGDSVKEEPEWKRTLPPGYMFAPLDKEIFKHYLLPRVKGEYFHPGVIPEIDIYQCQPSQLPGLDDPKQTFSYFFTKTDKKHENGKRVSRFTKDQKGHWRITSKIQEVTGEDGQTVIGRKNVLVYMDENKVKTNWIMHEYMLDHNYANKNQGDKLDTSVVVCRIYERKKAKDDCENNNNNSDESEARDVEQKSLKRGLSSSSSSSQSDDPGESSSRDKRWKLCMINETPLNTSPLDAQPPATMMMQTAYWEETLQPLSDQLPYNNNAINNNACSSNTFFVNQPQLHHSSYVVQPMTCQQQPVMMQNNGEEVAVLPSLDQMAFNNEGIEAHILSWDELQLPQLPNLHPMKKFIPQPRKEPNFKGEGKEEEDSSNFDTNSFFL